MSAYVCLVGPINWFYPTANDWGMIGFQSALAIGNGILTATLVGGALPMLENLFESQRHFLAGSIRS